jgi:hypothetical protein
VKRRGTAVLVAAGAWIACGPVGAPPELTYVVNTCVSACKQPDPLPAASCTGGRCVSNAALDPRMTMVFAIPGGSRVYPSVTIIQPLGSLLAPETVACHRPCVRLRLPQPTGERSSLEATDAFAALAGLTLGGQNASLPATVVYYPLAKLVVSASATTFVDARLSGLPLLPVRALADPRAARVPGPNGVQGFGWRVSFGPGDYERDIVPTDDRFPPKIDTQTFDGLTNPITVVTGVDDAGLPGSTELTVIWPEQDLRGFQVYLRDATTKRRVSSRVTIGESAPPPMTLNTVDLPDGGLFEKVLAPPEGMPIPEFADPLPPRTIGIGTATVPILPTPLTVSGLVETADNVPLEADLIIESTPVVVDKGGIAIQTSTDSNRNSSRRALSFATTTRTSSKGHYDVTLPPGEYDVFVSPVDPNAAAAASNSMTILIRNEPPYTAAAQTQHAARFVTLRGVVRAGDGRPLPAATVEVHPDALTVATIDPRRWRHVRSTTTAADGSYAIDVEPGTLDLIVRPVEGTGFPVTTRSNLDVTADASPSGSGDVVVPAPVITDFVLDDYLDNPVAGASVGAFAETEDAGAPATVPRGQTQIGRAMTDGTGHFEMLLVPPK